MIVQCLQMHGALSKQWCPSSHYEIIMQNKQKINKYEKQCIQHSLLNLPHREATTAVSIS